MKDSTEPPASADLAGVLKVLFWGLCKGTSCSFKFLWLNLWCVTWMFPP